MVMTVKIAMVMVAAGSSSPVEPSQKNTQLALNAAHSGAKLLHFLLRVCSSSFPTPE